jgi:hypothetical protein
LHVEAPPDVIFGAFDGDPTSWRPAPELAFEVEPPVVDSKSLSLSAVLDNRGTQPIEVVTLAGGPAGASTNPWNVTPKLEQRARPAQPRRPEVYPHPTRATLPPGARVRYRVTFDLSQYETTPGQSVEIAYRFALWNEPRSGTVTVRLP